MSNIQQTESGLLISSSLGNLEKQAHVDQFYAQALIDHDNPNDSFGLLSIDDSPSPELVRGIQSIETIAALGRSATSKDLVEFGKLIVPDIEDYVGIMLERKDLINHLIDRLDQGDLVVATNHRDVIGVALGLGITSVCIQENGVRADEFDTDIAVSAMLKYVTTKKIPAVQAMQGLFSRVRFVIPAGNSNAREALDDKYIEKFNEDSNSLLQSKNDVPIIYGVAPSGTRDRQTKWRFPKPGERARSWLMKRPSPNTVKFYFVDSVLGMSIDLSEDASSGLYISRLYTPDPEIDLSTRSEMIMADLANADGMPKLKSALID